MKKKPPTKPKGKTNKKNNRKMRLNTYSSFLSVVITGNKFKTNLKQIFQCCPSSLQAGKKVGKTLSYLGGGGADTILRHI